MSREQQALAQLRQDGLVDVVAGLAEHGETMDWDEFTQLAGDAGDAAYAREHLIALGLVVGEQSVAAEQQLTALGGRVAAMIEQSRGPGGADRHEAVARGLLTWISNAEYDRSTSSDFLKEESATAFGQKFQPSEILHAEEYLKDNGLIKGSASTAGLLRVKATPRGRQVLRDQRPIDEQMTGVPMMSSSTTHNSVTVGGDMHGSNIAAGGQHHQQHATQTNNTLAPEDRQQLQDALQQLLPILPAQEYPQAHDAVLAAAEKANDPHSTIDELSGYAKDAITAMAVNNGAAWLHQHGNLFNNLANSVQNLIG